LGMKQTLLILMAVVIGQSVMAADVVITDPFVRDLLAGFLKKPAGKFAPSPKFTEAELASVTKLSLSKETKITDAGLKDMAKLKKLAHLDLSGTNITDEGFKATKTAEDSDLAKQLRILGFTEEEIEADSDVKAEKIAGWFQNLTDLSLGGTKITDAGLKDIAKMQQLTDLSLNETKITDAGIKDIAKLQKLTYLNLEFTEITDAGIKDIAKLRNLTTLYLGGTKITSACFRDIAKMQNLKNLGLSRPAISNFDVAELKKAMPKCSILHLYQLLP
jgi:internalin A